MVPGYNLTERHIWLILIMIFPSPSRKIPEQDLQLDHDLKTSCHSTLTLRDFWLILALGEQWIRSVISSWYVLVSRYGKAMYLRLVAVFFCPSTHDTGILKHQASPASFHILYNSSCIVTTLFGDHNERRRELPINQNVRSLKDCDNVLSEGCVCVTWQVTAAIHEDSWKWNSKTSMLQGWLVHCV